MNQLGSKMYETNTGQHVASWEWLRYPFKNLQTILFLIVFAISLFILKFQSPQGIQILITFPHSLIYNSSPTESTAANNFKYKENEY